MNRDFLLSLSVEELFQFARNYGLNLYSLINKEELVDKLIEWLGIDDISKQFGSREIESYSLFRTTLERISDLDYPIPERYDDTKIVLMIKDPDWAFVYWDLKSSALSFVKDRLAHGEVFVLRIYEFENISDRDNCEYGFYFDIPIQITDFSWYVNLPNRGSYYRAEIGTVENNNFHSIVKSNDIYTPLGIISVEEDPSWISDTTDELIELSTGGTMFASLDSHGVSRRITTLSGFHHFYNREDE